MPGASSHSSGAPGSSAAGAVDHRRQRVVIDLDQLGRVARDLARVGDDEGDGIADMPHLVGGQREARRHDHRRGRRHLGDARHRAEPLRRQIAGGEDATYPRQGARRTGIDAGNLGMGMRRAQHMAVELARRVDIVDEPALAAQKACILEAGQRAPDLPVLHRHSLGSIPLVIDKRWPSPPPI